MKERPWATVLRLETDRHGPLFLKACGPAARYETRLVVDIGARRPGLAPDVLAVDHEAGWLLMPDHGRAMTGSAADEQVGLVEQLLGPYAELQQQSADLVGGWLAAGLVDRSLERLPALLDDLLDRPLAIGAEERAACAATASTFASVCRDLATSAVPRAVDHADIHGTNVLTSTAGPRLVDWGDAVATHPLGSLLVPIEWVAVLVPPADRPAAARRLRDAYLEPWGGPGRAQEAALATWVAYVVRAISTVAQAAVDDPEVAVLLRAWRAQAAVLHDPDELLRPAMAW